MTKIFSTLLFVLGIYASTFAQTKDTVELGINTGYNSAYVIQTGTNANSALVNGFNVGVSVDYYYSDRWSFKAKVNYDQKGWGNGYLISNDGTGFAGVNYKLNYITIPVMANWHFGRKRNWYLHFGPYLGILANANAGSHYLNPGNINVTEFFKSNDVGLDLGIGVKIPVTTKAKFFIEADGQGGIMNVFKEGASGQSLQNSRSSLNIGFNFSLD